MVGILLIAVLAIAAIYLSPRFQLSEPFTVYDPADNEHRHILPPNAGIGSLQPDLLPLDKQNADMRGPHALLRHVEIGKVQGQYRSPSFVMSQDTGILPPI